ncbi:Reverse transcriptase domain and Integrase, catalytic core domain and Zinc finger, CCHC-type domain and Peptidase A2A, retrovirus, catalytic domain and Ribonuclease H-like domain and Peptidase A2A, retrovirus RVP subgroup domain and Aspartic peptidase domain-containing protein [Strongyloides ratti]|uniref:RNA-directed DNA polymerase n=1 Tax=Strongyloides ratti TaxID=34506 RepID=A0A090KVV1_STRRB|nr:Reverse transcriptase domain and Integrase, catalytic core domain and Zinc finger, CCHC-type domain and Peptidase A2A, retrovirus, catalytic domain and Ribonuclease H-like domain and Peptidase A2A, retrovirus RVP subgroup domain and Aspartic peptidase domain-containing protein [Strongyloides ratti]CEF61625.1 Reverse transcriptase domain and Integrase, catalytic core domain and Zinc finger, CCHC-type domain and Peptidase A2A, retrovirus, catalytic domain and Ribonuclease H-like domain and Peptid
MSSGPTSVISNSESTGRPISEPNAPRYTLIPQGTVPEFNPKKEKWIEYKERFEIACELHGIHDKKMAKALLMGALVPETYRKLRIGSAPRKPIDLPLNEVISLLDSLHEQERNNLISRIKLLEIRQSSDESVMNYVERLRDMVGQCSLDNIQDAKDLISTIVFTKGLKSDNLKRAVYQQHQLKPTSSLNESINSAMGVEVIGDSNVVSVNAVKFRKKSGKALKSLKCFCCNKTGHLKKDCRLKDKKCDKCKKIGHIKSACKARSRIVGYINESEVDEDSESENGIFTVSANKINNSKINVDINKIETEFLLDTGACKSLLSEHSWKRIGKPEIKEKTQALKDFSGNKIEIMGQINVLMRYKQMELKTSLLVVKGSCQDLIGRDLIDKLKVDLNQAYYGKHLSGINNIENEIEFKEKLKLTYPFLFSKGLGKFNGDPIVLKLRENATPKVVVYRCSNLNLKQKVMEEIDRLIKLDVWEKVHSSEWISPMSVALKSNGKIRICANFSQTVNKMVDVEQFQIPTTQELFSRIEGCKIFSNLDISDAFLAIQVAPESRKLLVVSTPAGLMQFKRLPFGLSSSPMIFQRIMSNLLSEIDGTAVYFDDVLIGGKDEIQHDERVHKVLEKLEKSGMKLNMEKSVIRKDQIKYLGNIVNGEGIRPDPEKTKAISLMRKPENASELKSFLGMVIHYGKFIPKLSIIAKPLNNLTRKNAKYEFDKECERSFSILKEILSSNKILVPYSISRPVVFASDASQFGYGAVILHRFEDGSEKPIEYISKTFNSAQLNYSQIEKECCGIVNGILRFKDYLLGRKFILQTDSLPLKFLLAPDTSLPNIILRRIDRWSCQIKRFQYTTEYVNTKMFGKADALSRLPLLENQEWEKNDTEAAAIMLVENSPLNTDKVRIESGKDKVFKQLIKFIKIGWPKALKGKLKEFDRIKLELAENNGIIMKGEQLVIPLCLRKEVLQKLHLGHTGIVRMKILARSNVYWPGMNKEIENLSKTCETCNKIGTPVAKTNLHPWQPSVETFERIHIDLCGPMNGKTFLVLYDTYSCYPFIVQVKKGDSEEIIEILDKIFIDFTYPKLLVSDNGPNLVSAKMNEYLRSNGIKHLTAAPYHPQSNGAAENLVKKFKISYYRSINDGNSSKESVKIFLKSYRNSPSSRTGKCPVELMFNRKVKIINDEKFFGNKKLTNDNITPQKEISRKPKKLNGNISPLKETSRKSKKLVEFKVNDPVWERVKNSSVWKKDVIKERIGVNMYKLLSNTDKVRHTNQLKKRMASPIRYSERLRKLPRINYKV